MIHTAADPGRIWSLLYFVRFSGIGYSLALPLLGAATVTPSVAAPVWIRLCLIATSFHIFAFVLNDVIDLPIDRTEPRRAGFPLVRGTVRPGHALALSLLQIPISFAIALRLGVPTAGLAALAGAFALMAIYNVWGKRSPVALLTDSAQSLAWASLALFGALAVGGSPGLLSGVVLGYVSVYVIMVNGVHGGMRDLSNDLACGVRSTAIQLGARIGPDGQPTFSARLLAWAVALQTLLAVLALLPFLRADPAYATAVGHVSLLIVVAGNGASYILLASARNPVRDQRDRSAVGLMHMVFTMVAVIALIVPLVEPGLAALIAILFTAPLLTHSASYRCASWTWRMLRRARSG
jgi:4-hydroxybenzoate polyprenyltransferase